MCGRLYQKFTPDWIRRRYGTAGPTLNFAANWNGAPTQSFPIVLRDEETGERRLELMRWGLVPFWAKDMSIGNKCINAMVETAATKPAFREAVKRRRCIVPASGFYEWKKTATGKQPYAIAPVDPEECFSFAGLWERWKSPEGETIKTFTIMTGPPNELAGQIHNRMPLILQRAQEPAWLGEGPMVPTSLEPFPAALMRTWPVSREVGSVRNNRPELVEAITAYPFQSRTLSTDVLG